jgi:transcriptional regulator GlxA family with amidase domain
MDPRVEAVRTIIETEYASRLTVPGLAVRAGLSRSHLAFLFKKETGLRLKACLREVRLRHAAALLRENGLSIKQVLFAAGYREGSNFDHDFRFFFGKTPCEYRRERPPTPKGLQA